MAATCFGPSWAIIKEYRVKREVTNKQHSTYHKTNYAFKMLL